MDDPDERDLLLARRLKLGVRLVIYPMLLGLLVVAWHARGASGSPAKVSTWRGTTTQNRPVRATFGEEQLQSVELPVTMRCDDGDTYLFTWTPTPDIYRQGDDLLTAHRLPTTLVADARRSRTYEGHLRLDLGDHPRGTVSVTETWTWTAKPDGTRTVCDSGPVAFSLARWSPP